MKLFQRTLSTILSTAILFSVCGCSTTNATNINTSVSTNSSLKDISNTDKTTKDSLSDYKQDMESLTFQNDTWNYDKENDVYWMVNITYCANPETKDYETMGIYIPGAYMDGVKNSDGTYSCTINTTNKINGYSAKTAPIIFPVNTAGYSAQKAPTSYSYNGISSYLQAGFIYVYSGMRGRNNGYDEAGNLIYSGGAPWGVTDLKAAVRYYRYNKDLLPGNTDSIFTFGHSGGGAQSALMGATGDSELYYDYLKSIGAAMYDKDGNYISDAICGAMCWCPITSLDYANEAYEWNMGQYISNNTRTKDTWTYALSKDLSKAFASYINKLGLKDKDGTILTLEKSKDGIYTLGSYYDYILSVIEDSLNKFLNDTKFPYTENSNNFKADGGFAGGDNRKIPNEGEEMPSEKETIPSNDRKIFDDETNQNKESKTYETVKDYIKALNSDEKWIKYNAKKNKASITSIEAFVKYCKSATKSVGAFDDLNRSQAENLLFGNDENDALHFDTVMANLLEKNKKKYSSYEDWDSSIVKSYLKDIATVDKLGNSIEYRQNMYNPMYYISSYYNGYGTSKVASYWRIHSGINQGDTALTVETNLALALEQYKDVKNVEFETVWGQGHTTAERTGNSTDNFIKWVNTCLK